MTIKVLMTPHLLEVQKQGASGIRTVVEKYFHHLPAFDIELVPPRTQSFDVWAVHAGMTDEFLPNDPIVSHCHGLYWTADKLAEDWENIGNRAVIHAIRHARLVTVPSRWVAETFARDMHLMPEIIPHGVDWKDWQEGTDEGYVLWNKNRTIDVCSPKPVNELAMRRPSSRFLTTFAEPDAPPNIKVTGQVPHETMRVMVMHAGVYLSTVKETFGIGTLEAMASGVPVLGFDYGGTSDLIKHGFNGYLARPGDYDDLAIGLDYCQSHRMALGRNAALSARDYSWENAAQQVASGYARTLDRALDEANRYAAGLVLNQNVGRNPQTFVQGSDHPQRQGAFTVQNL